MLTANVTHKVCHNRTVRGSIYLRWLRGLQEWQKGPETCYMVAKLRECSSALKLRGSASLRIEIRDFDEAERVMNALKILSDLGTRFPRLMVLAKRYRYSRYTVDIWAHNVRRGRRDSAAVALESAWV